MATCMTIIAIPHHADHCDTSFSPSSSASDLQDGGVGVECLHDVAPRYLADLCVQAESADGHRQSRSAVSGALLVSWTQTL